MGEHQCVVTQVIYSGAPIVNGANPATSDKISQRNLAISTVANPGSSASRIAMHTFEIEATPGAISAAFPPDELLLGWSRTVPGSAYVTSCPDLECWRGRRPGGPPLARHEIRPVNAHPANRCAGDRAGTYRRHGYDDAEVMSGDHIDSVRISELR